jgi:phospholipid/cholesterol/gamma-HCH transport system ATP-binding protein
MSIPEPTIIEVESVATYLGSTWVHREVSFIVDRPQVIALIGGSGCGKTVLLREMLGLLRPTSGHIKIWGHNLWALSENELQELRGRIGVLYQNNALFSALTVAENIATVINERMRLAPPLVQELIELRVLLTGLPLSALNKKPSELSGGMKKRAALARAIALEPELLFLDEPTSGLDPINARAFDSLVRTLCDAMGICVLMVTHDLDSIWGIADRVIVLGEGKVLADGSPQQVAQQQHEWIQEYFAARVGTIPARLPV